jgi:hypothetical protein
MRKALLLAAGLALIGMPAWSQSPSRDDDDDRRERHGRAMRDNDDGDDRSGRGARFSLRSGDTQLRIVHSGEESTQTCVDAALRMFDRVQSQPRAATSSPTPTTPPTPQ